MKTKIIYEDFNKEIGTTLVTIQNKYGHFTGEAHCHPDDEYSMFQGERIAVIRANIKFCKHRIIQEKAKIKALKELETSFFNRTLYNKIKECQKNIENYKTSIIILKDSIKKIDEERQKILLRSNKNK